MSRLHSSSSALDILKKDHRELSAKFKLYEKMDSNDRKQELAVDICNSLSIHFICEQELLYPLAQRIIDKSQVHVGEIEHDHIRKLIEAVTDDNPTDEERDALVKVLSEYTHAHIKQEENALFPLLRNSVLDLKMVGIAMLELRFKMIERFRIISEFETMDLPSVKMN